MTLLDEFEQSISKLKADELQEMIEQAREDSKDSEIMCESLEDVR